MAIVQSRMADTWKHPLIVRSEEVVANYVAIACCEIVMSSLLSMPINTPLAA